MNRLYFKLISHRWLASFILTILLSLQAVLLVRTATTSSWTYDEKLHLQSAIEWLNTGSTPSDPFNPPLSKLPTALLYLLDPSIANDPFLLWPRLSIIAITLILSGQLFWYLYRKYSIVTATLGLSVFAFEPTVLAHGSVFTTDMFATWLFFASWISLENWRQVPAHHFRQALVWLTISALAATKVTALAMLLVSWLLFTLFEKKVVSRFKEVLGLFKPHWIALSALLIWLAYGLRFASPLPGFLPALPLGGFLDTLASASCFVVCEKYEATRTLYFAGDVSGSGWLVYPTVAMVLKSSLIVWFGLVVASTSLKEKPNRQKYWLYLAPILAVWLLVTTARYSTGIRHVLPAWPFLSVWIAITITQWLPSQTWKRWLLGVLMISHILVTVSIQDYLSYFNPIIGRKNGGSIIADSNLDWGQNLWRVQSELDPSAVDWIVTPSPGDVTWYGYSAERLSPEKALNQNLSGQTVLMSRSSWYLHKYSQIDAFNRAQQKSLAGDTLLLITFPKD